MLSLIKLMFAWRGYDLTRYNQLTRFVISSYVLICLGFELLFSMNSDTLTIIETATGCVL